MIRAADENQGIRQASQICAIDCFFVHFGSRPNSEGFFLPWLSTIELEHIKPGELLL
jgi:hypothetical protein